MLNIIIILLLTIHHTNPYLAVTPETTEHHCTVQQVSSCVLFFSRYLGEEDGSKSNGESRSKALLCKLQERAKAREQQSRATKKESDVQGTKASEQSGVGKTKRKHEQREEGKKQPKKKRKESVKEAEDVADTPAKHTDLATSDQSPKKKKKKNIKEEEMQKTGSSVHACKKVLQEGEVLESTGAECQKPAVAQPEQSDTTSSFHVLGGFENKAVQKVPVETHEYFKPFSV